MWTWEIPCYFFAGGLAGASAGLALRCRELRGNDVARAARLGRSRSPAIGVSPALLISDLGRPARFLNMLRMFKVTSPMSVGSWILARQRRDHGAGRGQRLDSGCFPRLARSAKPGGGAARPAAVHLHRRADRQHRGPGLARGAAELPFVFGAGAALSAGAAA